MRRMAHLDPDCLGFGRARNGATVIGAEDVQGFSQADRLEYLLLVYLEGDALNQREHKQGQL